MSEYRFTIRWKEELVIEGGEQSLVVEMTMGRACVYFPTEEMWREKAPTWAHGEHAEILRQLQAWAKGQNIPVEVTSAWVYAE